MHSRTWTHQTTASRHSNTINPSNTWVFTSLLCCDVVHFTGRRNLHNNPPLNLSIMESMSVWPVAIETVCARSILNGVARCYIICLVLSDQNTFYWCISPKKRMVPSGFPVETNGFRFKISAGPNQSVSRLPSPTSG